MGSADYVTNCPNCGAPLRGYGHCEYCGTVIRQPLQFLTIRPGMKKLVCQTQMPLEIGELAPGAVAEYAKRDIRAKMSEYADSDDNIPGDAAIMREWRKPKEKKWTVEFRRKAYVPQCTDSTCVGRSQKKFQSEGDAVRAWNRRA